MFGFYATWISYATQQDGVDVFDGEGVDTGVVLTEGGEVLTLTKGSQREAGK